MDSRKKSTAAKRSSSLQLSTVYLLIYNSVLTIGFVYDRFARRNNSFGFISSWTLILFEIVKRVLSYRSLNDLRDCYGLWNAIEVPLKICQTAAFLEVNLIT